MPVFVIEPVPEMTPAYVVLSLLPPMVSVLAARVTRPPVEPPPDNEPIEILLASVRPVVAALAILTGLLALPVAVVLPVVK